MQPEQVAVSAQHLVIVVSPVQRQTTHIFLFLLVILLVATKHRPLTSDFTTDMKREVRGVR